MWKKVWNNRQVIGKIAKLNASTKITLLDQAIVSGSNFLMAILLTRLAGLELYGSFALAWMGLLLVSSMHQAFILLPMMSLAPKKEASEREQYYKRSQLLHFGFSLLILLIISPVVAFADQLLPRWQVSSLFPVLPLAIFAYLVQDYYRRYFFIRGKARYALCIDIIAYPGMIIGIVCSYLMGTMGIEQIYSLVLLSFGLAALVGMAIARLSLTVNLAEIRDILLEHWRFSSWLLGTAVLQFFSSNYFLVAGAALMGPEVLGALRIAHNLLGLTHVLFQAMENVVPVKASAAYVKNGYTGMLTYLKAITLKSGIVVGGILLILALLAKPVLTLVYGEVYSNYSNLLIGYCVFYLALFPGYPLRYALRTLELTRPIFVAYILSTAFSLLCAFAMVEAWGLAGVVAGLIITQVLMQTYYAFSLNRSRT